MPVKSRWTIDIPDCHLATLVFKSPTEPTSKELRLFLDADRPDTHYFTPYEFRLWSQRFAAGLRKSGVEPGDRILFFSPNDLFFPVVFMGTVMAGAIFSGCNPSYTPRELAHQLKDSRAKYLLSADAVLDTAFEGAKIAGLGRDSIFVFNNQVYDGKGQGKKGCQYWGDLIASKEEGARFVWDDLTAPGAAENTTIALNYSSGTTGVAKGVEISHKNYVANSLQVQNLQSLDSKVDISDTRILCFLPMYHAYAQISIVVAMSRGTQIYIMSRFDLLKMLQYIQRFRITSISAVPPVIIALAKHPAVKKFDLSSIRTLASAAAPLGREITKECESLWPDGQVNIKQAWGMTEYESPLFPFLRLLVHVCGSGLTRYTVRLTCSALGWDPTEKCNSSSVGELNANCEAKIMADDGVTELGQNERGELWIRGPNLMKGYWRNLKATKDTITEDGWLKSGDIAYVDDSGKFFVVDRIKVQTAPMVLRCTN